MEGIEDQLRENAESIVRNEFNEDVSEQVLEGGC